MKSNKNITSRIIEVLHEAEGLSQNEYIEMRDFLLKEKKMRIKGIKIKENSEIITLDIVSDHCTGEAQYNTLNPEVLYCTYEEKDDEDVYNLLHDWVERNIDVKVSVCLKNDIEGILKEKENEK